MDADKIKGLEKQYLGRQLGGAVVESYVNSGKSAAVFKATRDGKPVAVKIFDRDLVDKYGEKSQSGRIDRELKLIGHDHHNLIQIYDGGIDSQHGNHFIVMEYLNGRNLREALEDIPFDRIPLLIDQQAHQ